MSTNRPKVRIRVVASVLLTLGLFVSWAPLFGRWHWFPALFDHFRLQSAIAALIAVPLALFARSRKVAAFGLATLAYHAWPLVSVHQTLARGVASDSPSPLRLICFNVLVSNSRHDRVLNWLREVDPDVIILLEVTDRWVRQLETLRQTYAHGRAYPAEDCTGVAIYSRLPLSGVNLLDHGADTLPSITGTVEWAGRKVRLLGVHPIHPTSGKRARMMDLQLRDLAMRVQGRGGVPVIVAGDFNCAPWARQMRDFQALSGLGYRSAQPAWRPTWNIGHPLALAIDHTLCTSELFVERRDIGPDLGSDHRAQIVSLRWVSESGR